MAASPDPSPSPKPSPYNNYLRYSGLAIQLLATLGVCGWIGHKIDQWLNFKFPAFLLTLGLAGFAGSLYLIYKSITRK